MGRGRGQPTKLTAAVQNKIVNALAAGNTRTASAAYAGIHYSTFCNWITDGEKAKSGKYFDFFDAIKKAEADAEVSNVATIKKHAADNWQANAARYDSQSTLLWTSIFSGRRGGRASAALSVPRRDPADGRQGDRSRADRPP